MMYQGFGFRSGGVCTYGTQAYSRKFRAEGEGVFESFCGLEQREQGQGPV